MAGVHFEIRHHGLRNEKIDGLQGFCGLLELSEDSKNGKESRTGELDTILLHFQGH